MFLRAYTGVTTWWSGLKTRAAEEGGATAVEYALMVALIAVVIIAAVAFIGTERELAVQQRGWLRGDACELLTQSFERPCRPLTLPGIAPRE